LKYAGLQQTSFTCGDCGYSWIGLKHIEGMDTRRHNVYEEDALESTPAADHCYLCWGHGKDVD